VLGEWLGVTHTLNKGVMWGKFPQLADMLPYLRTVAALIVTWMALTTPASARRILWALGLVLGGAIGNIYDGFALGAVRDFILVDFDIKYFDPFPIFNVADSAICIGVGLLAIGLIAADGEGETSGDTEAKSDDGARVDVS
jgi:signal peptidase II